jgi:hypothetical protein
MNFDNPPAAIFIMMIGMATLLGGMVFSIPLYAIWTYHKRKLEEIKGRQRSTIDKSTVEAIDALRKEMAALRDMTTQYDMSFDTALKRLESRVGHVEQKMITRGSEQESERVRVGLGLEN